jgi:HPt (histidine-containing phosphotransfer) domain-containing protein
METFLKTYNNFIPAMREKCTAGDEKALLVEFHSLKGAAGSLGAVRLHGLTEQLEKQIKLQTLSFQDALNELETIWPAVLEDTETVLRELETNKLT